MKAVWAPLYSSWQQLSSTWVRDRRLLQSSIRLGSLSFALEVSRPEYSAMLYELLRVEAFEPSDSLEQSARGRAAHGSARAALALRIVDVTESTLREFVPQPDIGTVDYPRHGFFEIHRDAACCVVSREGILIAMRAGETDEALNLHCLMVVLYRALFHLGRVPLHAASIEIEGLGVCLFVGDKGSGKSTLSLHFGREGATVLGEDHSMIVREDAGFLVSGCDGRLRLTEKSEAHFFSEPLSATPVDVAGVPKKDVDLAQFVDSQPYVDRRVDRIYYPRVRSQFSLEGVSRAQSALRLLEGCSDRQRFVSLQDRLHYLDYLTALTDQVASYELSLSGDLSDLERLHERLLQGPVS